MIKQDLFPEGVHFIQSNRYGLVVCLGKGLIIVLTNLLWGISSVSSQPYQNLSQEQKLDFSVKLVEQTPFIFEATIIDFKDIEGEENKIYKTVRVRTIHSYKGDIPIGEELEIILSRKYLIDRSHIDPNLTWLSGFLGKNSKYVFLCKENDSFPIPQEIEGGQYYQFQVQALSSVIRDMRRIYGTNAWAGLYWLTFKNRTEMDNFLSEFEGMEVPPKKR